MTRAKTLLLAIVAALTFGLVGVAPSLAHAESCNWGYGASGAYSLCTGLPPGYCHRVRAHYLSGISGGGYVYGPWRHNGVASNVTHTNIDAATWQLAGIAC